MKTPDRNDLKLGIIVGLVSDVINTFFQDQDQDQDLNFKTKTKTLHLKTKTKAKTFSGSTPER